MTLGKDPASKSDEFLEKFQTALDSPPSILENYVAISFIMDVVAFMQGGIGQIVSVNISWYQYKTYPEPWNYSSFYQFHAQKALFKVPKICNIDFWIKNAPPLALFLSEKSSDLVEGSSPYEEHKKTQNSLTDTHIKENWETD